MIKPFIPIEVDKMRNIRFNSRSVRTLEEKFETSAIKFLKSLNEPDNVYSLTTDQFVTLLWLGLIHEDKELTHNATYDLWDLTLEKNGLDDSMAKIFEGLANYFGIGDEKQKIQNKVKNQKKK